MCVGELANMGIFLNINIQYTGQTGVVHLSIIGINVTNPLCVCLMVKKYQDVYSIMKCR